MATETVEKKERASVKKSAFGKQKQPDVIIYRLIEPNQKLREDTPSYPPYKRFPNTDVIVWEDGTRAIRWLPGFQSIFVDEQEAGNRVIPDNVLNNPNNRFEIIDGDIKVRPHEKTKIAFLDICNRNADSEHRTGTIAPLFRRYSEEGKVDELSLKQDKQKEALSKAYEAEEEQIAFHARYLGIPLLDAATSATRTLKAVKADYVQKAIENPDEFLKTFDDEDLKVKYYISKAIEESKISLKLIPGKAAWTETKAEICEIPNVTDEVVLINEIFSFSQKPTSEGFLKKLKEINK